MLRGSPLSMQSMQSKPPIRFIRNRGAWGHTAHPVANKLKKSSGDDLCLAQGRSVLGRKPTDFKIEVWSPTLTS